MLYKSFRQICLALCHLQLVHETVYMLLVRIGSTVLDMGRRQPVSRHALCTLTCIASDIMLSACMLYPSFVKMPCKVQSLAPKASACWQVQPLGNLAAMMGCWCSLQAMRLLNHFSWPSSWSWPSECSVRHFLMAGTSAAMQSSWSLVLQVYQIESAHAILP